MERKKRKGKAIFPRGPRRPWIAPAFGTLTPPHLDYMSLANIFRKETSRLTTEPSSSYSFLSSPLSLSSQCISASGSPSSRKRTASARPVGFIPLPVMKTQHTRDQRLHGHRTEATGPETATSPESRVKGQYHPPLSLSLDHTPHFTSNVP